MKRNISLALVLGILSVAFSQDSFAQLNVVATTPDFAVLAKEIGGDKVDVTTLGRPSEDPHFVDARPSFIVKLNRADVLIEGGADLEIGWLPALLEQARNEKIATGAPGHVACAQAVDLLEVPAALDRSFGDVHAAGNPHFMTDPLNAGKVAKLIADSFCRIDQPSCESFQGNLRSFSTKLDSKMIEWQRDLAPFKGAHIVAYHNSWPYFAKRFGLTLDLFLEPKPGIPPTPAHLAEVMVRMKSEQAHVIFVEPFLNRKVAEKVAQETGASVQDVAYFPGALEGTDDYISMIDKIVLDLKSALEKSQQQGAK
jgi:zinc/manganese transport system substrate-binding protein